MTTIYLILQGEPLAKQSVRFTLQRYYQPGTHICPYSGKPLTHKSGDIVTFRNKQTGCIDGIVKTYQEERYNVRKNAYMLMIKPQLPKGFTMFTEEVHIEQLVYVFPLLKSFSKHKIEAIKQGQIFYKNTKPDLPDNLKKFTFDCLRGVVWSDDSIIVEEKNTCKIYGIEPKILIKINGI